MSRAEQNSAEARYWIGQARLARRKQNLGWWADKSGPLLVFTGLAGFAALFYLRSLGVGVAHWQAAAGVLGAGALVTLTGYLLARRYFFSIEQALVRIESRMKMNCSLSAAAAGVGPWPDRQRVAGHGADDGVVWRLERLALPVVAFGALIVAGWLVPVSVNSKEPPPNEPMGWGQMEATLETLEQEEIVEPASLEKMREQIRELRDQSTDDWYSHSIMEATDNLRKNLDASVQDMADDLSSAEKSLDALQNHATELSDSARNKALNDFDGAMQGLRDNNMDLNKELMDELQNIDPSELNQLDQKQLDELRERLRNASGT